MGAAIDTVGTDEAIDVSLALVCDRRRIATIAAFDRAKGTGIKELGGSPAPAREASRSATLLACAGKSAAESS
jgi:hypothetical protein